MGTLNMSHVLITNIKIYQNFIENFFRRCIEVINEMYKKYNMRQDSLSPTQLDTHVSTIRAGLLLMRGLYKLGDGKLLQGLDDLHATAKEDAVVFPEKSVIKLFVLLYWKSIFFLSIFS